MPSFANLELACFDFSYLLCNLHDENLDASELNRLKSRYYLMQTK